MNPFDILYEKFKTLHKQNHFAKRAEDDLDLFQQEFQNALGAYHKEVDKSSRQACLEGFSFHAGLNEARLDYKDLPILLKYFEKEDLATLFKMEKRKIQSASDRLRRSGKTLLQSEIDFGYNPDKIRKMSGEEFSRLVAIEARITIVNALAGGNIDMAKQILISERDKKQKELEGMWALCKDFLAWVTGDFVSSVMKKFTAAKPPFDVKVLISEALDDKYDDLRKKYQIVRPTEDEPWDEVVKKAKRRGKLKPTRKIQEKEEKLLRVGGSTVVSENVESTSINVENNLQDVD
jgi:hypothetical protein